MHLFINLLHALVHKANYMKNLFWNQIKYEGKGNIIHDEIKTYLLRFQ